MNFIEILKKRRSIRKYKDTPVPFDVIKNIINDSILAPSAGNEQPWQFIIVNNQDVINRISDECKQSMLKRIDSNPNDYAKKYEKMLSNNAFHIFYHAPAVVLILGDAGLKNLYVDCALAAGYFMMSATSKGLGTCWVNFGTEIHNSHLRNELGLSDKHKIVAPLALGYPENIPGIPKRKKPEIINFQ